MSNYIHRAVISNNGEQISYFNSQGKKVTYQPAKDVLSRITVDDAQRNAKILFSLVNKYFTGDSPNITPQEQVKLRADFAKQAIPLANEDTSKGSSRILDIYEGMEFVLNTFSSKASDGGETITTNEVYQMFEIFHNWTK